MTHHAAPPKARVLPPVKPPRIIQQHFDIATYKVDQAHGYVEADCQHCGATIKGQKNVTSNFIQHMRRRHPDAYDRFAAGTHHRAKRPRLAAAKPPAPAPPRDAPPPEMTLENALVSATYRAARRTDCVHARLLSARTRAHVYLKREDTQVAGSPAFRAAYNHLAATPTSRAGIVAAGHAALPVAAAAHAHGKPCHVVLHAASPPALHRHVAALAAKLELSATPLDTARARAADMNRTFVDVAHPAADMPDAVAGYATLALELLQQRPHAARLLVSGLNAPLLTALNNVLTRLGRGVRLVAVLPDGVAPAEWHAVADVVTVSRDEMHAAVKAVFDDIDALLEPVGALSVAGCIKLARGLPQERLVCVVDSPLRDFGVLRNVSRAVGRETSCMLVVQRRDTDSLAGLMRELSGTAGGRVRVLSVRFCGWPLLLGLGVDDTTTAGQHVANLTSLGYRVTEITQADLDAADVVSWGTPRGKWGVYRVVLPGDAIVAFLSRDGAGRVSFEWDGGAGHARLLVGVPGEWCLGSVDELGGSYARVREGVPGLKLLGCDVGDGPGTADGSVVVPSVDVEGGVADIGMSFDEERRDMEVVAEGAVVGGGEQEQEQAQVAGPVAEPVAEPMAEPVAESEPVAEPEPEPEGDGHEVGEAGEAGTGVAGAEAGGDGGMQVENGGADMGTHSGLGGDGTVGVSAGLHGDGGVGVSGAMVSNTMSEAGVAGVAAGDMAGGDVVEVQDGMGVGVDAVEVGEPGAQPMADAQEAGADAGAEPVDVVEEAVGGAVQDGMGAEQEGADDAAEERAGGDQLELEGQAEGGEDGAAGGDGGMLADGGEAEADGGAGKSAARASSSEAAAASASASAAAAAAAATAAAAAAAAAVPLRVDEDMDVELGAS